MLREATLCPTGHVDGWGQGGVQKKPLVVATPTPVELKRTLHICIEKLWIGERGEGKLIETLLVYELYKKEDYKICATEASPYIIKDLHIKIIFKCHIKKTNFKSNFLKFYSLFPWRIAWAKSLDFDKDPNNAPTFQAPI